MRFMPASKVCTRCGERKSEDLFARNRNPDGSPRVLAHCKACAALVARAWREKNKERDRQLRKESRERHRERLAEENRKWREANAEWLREYARANRGRNNELKRRSRAEKPGHEAAVRRAWLEKNPDKLRRYTMKDRYRRRGTPLTADGHYYCENVIAFDPCSYCGGPAGTVDHIVPISGGGDGDWLNLTAACQSCNSTKHARSLLTFLDLRLTKPGVARAA